MALRTYAFAIFTMIALLLSNSASAQTTLNTDGGPGWIVQSDFLLWTVRSPGVEYAISDIGGVQDRGAVGQVLSLEDDYTGGIRLGLGKRVGDCAAGPEMMFTYTFFDSDQAVDRPGPVRSTFISSDNSENDDSDNINTLGVETIFPDDRATRVQASMNFDYQLYDLELAQSLILSDSLTLRLAAGGRAALIDQDFRVTYTGGDFQTAFNAFNLSNYRGGGFTLGSDLRWYVLPSVRFDLATTLGMLLGQFETRTFIPDDEPGVPTDVRHTETRMTPVLEMAMGLNYERKIGRFDTNFGLGYELTNWFNMEDSRVFSDSHQEGQNVSLIRDLSLDGLYGRFTINY